jgi:hypothetical protein
MQIHNTSLRTTLADVIGTPDSWPDYAARRDGTRVSMRGACISEFGTSELGASGGGLAIATSGGDDGPTLAVFFVEDAELRRRAMKVLKVGMNVNVAVRLSI